MAARRINGKTADEIARAVADRLSKYGGKVALFLFPNGTAQIVPSTGPLAEGYRGKFPNAEVGTYDCGARLERIIADVKASLAK
jgi:hypothetical protein